MSFEFIIVPQTKNLAISVNILNQCFCAYVIIFVDYKALIACSLLLFLVCLLLLRDLIVLFIHMFMKNIKLEYSYLFCLDLSDGLRRLSRI